MALLRRCRRRREELVLEGGEDALEEADGAGRGARGDLCDVLLDEVVDDLRDAGGGRAEDPAVLGRDVLEDAGEEDHEHVVRLLLGEHSTRVGLRLERDPALKQVTHEFHFLAKKNIKKTHEDVRTPVHARQVDHLLYDIHRLPLLSPVCVAILLHQLLHDIHIPRLVLLDRRRLVREERSNNQVPVLLMLRRIVKRQHEPVPLRQRRHVRSVRLVEPRRIAEHKVDGLDRLHDLRHGHDGRPARLVQVVLARDLEIREVHLRGSRREEREERVDAVRGVMAREVAHEELGEGSAERAVVGVARTVEVAPGREVPSCSKRNQNGFL